jgi:AcrR family transcriptional regulator
MDFAYIPALAAFSGSASGALATVLTGWMTLRRRDRERLTSRATSQREKLYKAFIEEASRLYADALVNDKSEIPKLVDLYALIGRMKISSSDDVIEAAEKAGRLIIETYLAPNRTFGDLPEFINEMDPLKDFSEACRRELRAAHSHQHLYQAHWATFGIGWQDFVSMSAQVTIRTDHYDTAQRMLATALLLYRRHGYKKTTVTDIARELSMSSANIYRFFRSKKAIDETVVKSLFNEILAAIIEAARSRGSATDRLRAVLLAIGSGSAVQTTHEPHLRDLIADAVRMNWPPTAYYLDRRLEIIRSVLVAGQACGEFPYGDATILGRCILTAMDGHLDLALTSGCAARPKLEQMIDFYVNAVVGAPSRPPVGNMPDTSSDGLNRSYLR